MLQNFIIMFNKSFTSLTKTACVLPTFDYCSNLAKWKVQTALHY